MGLRHCKKKVCDENSMWRRFVLRFWTEGDLLRSPRFPRHCCVRRRACKSVKVDSYGLPRPRWICLRARIIFRPISEEHGACLDSCLAEKGLGQSTFLSIAPIFFLSYFQPDLPRCLRMRSLSQRADPLRSGTFLTCHCRELDSYSCSPPTVVQYPLLLTSSRIDSVNQVIELKRQYLPRFNPATS